MKKSDIIEPSFWMIIMTLGLFWVPLLGPLITGVAGGYLAKKVLQTMLAAIVPAIVLVGIVVIVKTFFSLPFIHDPTPFVFGLYLVFHVAALFLGGIMIVKLRPRLTQSS